MEEILEQNNNLQNYDAVEQNIIDESLDYALSFKLDNFEGPLDLLLHLIKQSKMEIENVELAKITEQYLSMMQDIENVDLEKASEFIEVAATLIEIKSKALLPKLVEEENVDEEDPETLLLQRLQEYKLFKETAAKMKEIEDIDKFYKHPEEEANKFRIVLKDMQMDMLINAFTGIFYRVQKQETKNESKEIAKERFTVAQKIASIKDSLLIKKSFMFSELFKEATCKEEVVTTFMALLEMLKLQEIKVVQSDTFNDIQIIKAEEENNG